MTDAGRAARERVRLQAVERFAGGQKNREIAASLRVSERSVKRWRRQWCERGEAGVLSKGTPGWSRLSGAQVSRLERDLDSGPLVHGRVDQRWTLARITGDEVEALVAALPALKHLAGLESQDREGPKQ
ncbi:helix-turn-helix domain-containing protein [Kitasatospora sp. NPDC059812]|uniref:helix-turn-helix domain-containing protein n=1 Tax=Kitasatospora sp. NPDC059812 TaxID=3346958 RepID=UPI003651F32F